MPRPGTKAAADLSAREARRIALRAQGLLGPRVAGGPLGLLRHLRAVQLDTISVLARSHELVVYSRLGALPRQRIEKAYWGWDRNAEHQNAFEYWSHAACVLPMEDWPNFGFKREDRRARGRRWHRLDDAERVCGEVLAKLRSEGPLTANQLGGAKKGGPWWDWSDVKVGVEWLLDIGEVVCTKRVGFQRVYDLPERAIPPRLLGAEPRRAEQIAKLVGNAARALGIASVADLAAYCGLLTKPVAEALPDVGLERVSVEGWTRPAFAYPEALSLPSRAQRSRPVLLSPFDSTIWFRPRVEQLFGFRHRLEAYVPRHQRVHGYFSMPVLVGDRLIARVDPARDNGTLVARSVHLEGGEPVAEASQGIAAALAEAATWVDARSVLLERVTPPEARRHLAVALGALGAA